MSIKLAVSCMAMALITLSAPTIFAQNLDDSNSNSVLTSTSTSTSSSVVTSAGLMLIMISLTPERKRNTQLAAYLNANKHTLRQDLAMGAGPTIMDLSSAWNIERAHHKAFAKVLRKARPQLLPILAGTRVTVDDADRFVQIVHKLMLLDRALGPGARRMEATSS